MMREALPEGKRRERPYAVIRAFTSKLQFGTDVISQM